MMLPAVSLPVSTMFKAAPRKCQVNFSSSSFLFKPSKCASAEALRRVRMTAKKDLLLSELKFL